MRRKCAIVDIDGTLADVSHRRGYLPNWKKFFDAMGKDPVIEPVRDVVNRLSETGLEIVLCSGRPSNYERITEAWLYDYFVHYDELLMRPANDHSPDVDIKNRMLEYIQRDRDILIVIDDRQTVVDMWRDKGLVCLQAAPGDFDNGIKRLDTPKLGMLIGPSGAGKTYLSEDLIENYDSYVSSDQLRERFLGDFKDQSRNNEIFQIVHKKIKNDLDLGFSVLYDATNIKRKDRLMLLNNLPEGVEIQYYVVDRPLDVKKNHGGWRNEISVKGEPLIEKHHNTFQQNLKDIFRGDDRDNVTVFDLRDSRCCE